MRRPGARVALAGVAAVVLGIAVAAVVYVRNPSVACETQHVRFDPKRPELAGRVSADQLAVLSVDGPPQAFTVYFDPQSGSTIEEWDYFTTGREITFSDGAYQGGLEVPAPGVDANASIPQPSMYPWEVRDEATPECVVKLAGPALFRASALVLPGWNDGNEVARLWTLAGGGSMITVDDRLALVSIDPGEAMDRGQLETSELFVGTLGEGNNRMGAILSPGDKDGAYRLSLSPRGQGTTQEGTEVVFDLQGTTPDREFVLGTDARASVVDLDGAEKPARASGTVSIKRKGDALEVRIDGRVDDRALIVSGRMGSGSWGSIDRSLGQILREFGSLVTRLTSSSEPTASDARGQNVTTRQPTPSRAMTPAGPAATPTIQSTAAAPPDVPLGWRFKLRDTFDSNANKWPIGDEAGAYARWHSEIASGRYGLRVEREVGKKSAFVWSTINAETGPQFHLSIEVTQTGGSDKACGLRFAANGGARETLFYVSDADGKFRVWHSDGSGKRQDLIDWTTSPAIRSGQVNRLSVIGDGLRRAFFVNGRRVGMADVEEVDVQSVGVAAFVEASDPVLCSFDNFEVRVP